MIQVKARICLRAERKYSLADHHDTNQGAHNIYFHLVIFALADHRDTSQSAIMSKRIDSTPWLIMAAQTKEEIFSLPL